MEETRLYFDVPASGAGTDGTNYDPTLYGYDDMGRRWRTKEAHGTITRTVFDARGKVTETHVGTNDANFTNGESSGTDNMVKTASSVYDAGSDGGDGYLTKQTQYVVDGTTDKRETTYTYDVRGRMLLEERPEAPHAFHKYDNQGNRLATGLFSSTASISATSDDPTTETTNRLALTERAYDDLGRVWKTTRHEIDASDGSSPRLGQTRSSNACYGPEGVGPCSKAFLCGQALKTAEMLCKFHCKGGKVRCDGRVIPWNWRFRSVSFTPAGPGAIYAQCTMVSICVCVPWSPPPSDVAITGVLEGGGILGVVEW